MKNQKEIAERLSDLSKVLAGIDWNEDFFHDRVHDFEPYDQIKMTVVPRFKTSGLSGDEWRHGVKIELMFKGVVVKEQFFSRMEYAVGFLYSVIHDDKPATDEWLRAEEKSCDQTGCSKEAEKWFAIRRRTDQSGHFLEKETDFVYYRKFCKEHAHRGDASREDSDSNYVAIKRP